MLSSVILPLFGILVIFTRNLKRFLVPNISIVAWPRCELVRTKVVLHGEYSCIRYSVAVGMLVSVATTIIKGVRGSGVKQDIEAVFSMSGWI